MAGSLEAAENQKRQRKWKARHAHKVRPTESSVRNTGGLPEPLFVAQGVRLGLESASCFHQRGGGWLQLTEPNTTDKGTEHCTLN